MRIEDSKLYQYFEYERPRKTKSIFGQSFQGVIFQKEDGWVPNIKEYLCPKIEYWTPQQKDIRAAETGVLSCANQVKPNEVKNYRRQYVGILKGGRKYLFINFFSPSFDVFDWKKKPMISSFEDIFISLNFSFLYQVEDGTCSNLNSN